MPYISTLDEPHPVKIIENAIEINHFMAVMGKAIMMNSGSCQRDELNVDHLQTAGFILELNNRCLQTACKQVEYILEKKNCEDELAFLEKYHVARDPYDSIYADENQYLKADQDYDEKEKRND